jgi:hypothetical protein
MRTAWFKPRQTQVQMNINKRSDAVMLSEVKHLWIYSAQDDRNYMAMAVLAAALESDEISESGSLSGFRPVMALRLHSR